MPLLGSKKTQLLEQVEAQRNTINLNQLVALINKWEDLSSDDFEGYIDSVLFMQLKEASRDPHETEMWNKIQTHPRDTSADLQTLLRVANEFVLRYPKSVNNSDAQSLIAKIPSMIAGLREKQDWESLDRRSYGALQSHKGKYPDSVHLNEIDDLMWIITKSNLTRNNLGRYLSDWPTGQHASEAQNALNSIDEWESIKRNGDIFDVFSYRETHSDSPFINEANALYYRLHDEEMDKMKANPSEYDKDTVIRFLNSGIYTEWELMDEGLITEESLEILNLDRALFPNIQDYMIEDPNVQAMDGCTDIYLFGTPGTGKTCLLMGLTGASGEGYTLNMKVGGGEYAAALQEYVNAGLTPGSTFGKFVTTINGQVIDKDKRGNYINHRINLVEMSGEEFALRIAENKEVSLANMGTGVTNLLLNNNRKVFFIIVDSSKDKVKVEYVEQVKDAEGNVIDERIRKKYISQLTILQKFISLFELPENQEIMKRVDAIHFVVTKADMLGEPSVRKENARNLLLKQYSAPVESLKLYCRQTKRINYSTNYNPYVFTFSLGKFYLGDVYSFDKTEAIQIIDTIRNVTFATKEKSFWDRIKDALG